MSETAFAAMTVIQLQAEGPFSLENVVAGLVPAQIQGDHQSRPYRCFMLERVLPMREHSEQARRDSESRNKKKSGFDPQSTADRSSLRLTGQKVHLSRILPRRLR